MSFKRSSGFKEAIEEFEEGEMNKENKDFMGGVEVGRREGKQQTLKVIQDKKEYYKKLWLKAVDEQNKHQEDIFYNTYFCLEEIEKELKEKK
jgi:hypothetical protein